MANITAKLVVPLANGAGASVDTSTMGPNKVVIVKGTLQGIVNIEISQDDATWIPVATINGAGLRRFKAVARYMRATVSGFMFGVATCDVGASSSTTLYATLQVPATDGPGASVDVSSYGAIWTVTVDMSSPTFEGLLIIEASQYNQDWTQAAPVFSAGGQRTVEIYASHIRVTRVGYSQDATGGTITVQLGAAPPATGDGVGAYSVTDYDARGDGVTDDRIAIEATLNAAKASGINHIYFPPGTYMVSRQEVAGGVVDVRCGLYLKNYPGMTLSGAGPSSIIKMLITDGFANPWRGLIRLICSDVSIHCLRLDGAWDGTTGMEEQIHLLEVGSPGTVRGVVSSEPDGIASTVTLATLSNAARFAVGNLVQFYADLDGSPIDDPIVQPTGILTLTGNANDGETITAGNETYTWKTTLSVGTGDTIGGVVPNMTLTDPAGLFTADMAGRYVHITGATANGNNGTFLVTAYTSATEITYTNAVGVAEAFAGTWTFSDEVLIGASASVSIDNLIAAIIATAGAGTTYGAGTTGNPRVLAYVGDGDTMIARAKDTSTLGAVPTTETMANGSWSSNTLNGGPYTVQSVDTVTGVITFTHPVSIEIASGMHMGSANMDTERINIHNVQFRNSAGDGLRLQGEDLYKVRHVATTECSFINCKRAALTAQRNIEDISFTHCYAENVADAIVDMETSAAGNAAGPRRITISDCEFARKGGHGVNHLLQVTGLTSTRKSEDIAFVNLILRGGGLGLLRTRNVRIIGGSIVGRDDPAGTAPVLDINGSDNVYVGGGCIITRPANAAAGQVVTVATDSAGGGVACDGVIIEKCFINQHVASSCVAVNAASNVTIDGCQIRFFNRGTATAGINARATLPGGTMQNLAMINNIIRGDAGGGSLSYAIQFQADNAIIGRTLVAGNTGQGFARGARYAVVSGSFNTQPMLGLNHWLPSTSGYLLSAGTGLTHIIDGGNAGAAQRTQGTGAPTFTASKGSIYLRTDGVAGTCGAAGTLRYLYDGTAWIPMIDG
jgi:Pectate lyase superfamily protein